MQPSHPIRVSLRTCAVVFVAFLAVLLPFLDLRPLWLDEVLTLLGVRGTSAAAAVRYAARNPGGAPLGYLAEWLVFQLTAYSSSVARLLPAVFGAASATMVYALGVRLGFRAPLLGAGLFFLTPLPFRYALEARPYSMALFFSLVATFVVTRMSSRRAAIAYFVANTAAVYTHPYAFFPALGHLLWATCWFEDRPATRRIAGALCASAVCFMPWALYAQEAWRESIASLGPLVSLSPETLVSMLRELTGGGFAGSLVLLSLAGIGLYSAGLGVRVRLFLVATVAMPVLAALAANTIFGYFFAIRQFLFILPLLVLLAAEGLPQSPRRAWLGAGVALLFLFGNYRFLSVHNEDWQAAASELYIVSRSVDCIESPAAAMDVYAYFLPSLPIRTCAANDKPGKVAFVIAPYFGHTAPHGGFRVCEEHKAGGTRIQVLTSAALWNRER